MDNELKEKWVAALRSGEYKQGKCALFDSNKNTFCCLGVLGLCLGKSAAEMDGDNNPPNWELGVEPRKLMDLAYDWNDRDGKSFAEIADFIEQTF